MKKKLWMKEGEEVYLYHLSKNIFKSSYQGSQGQVHGQNLDEIHGQFSLQGL